MKRPSAIESTVAHSGPVDDLESKRREYKKARKAYKQDKSNPELKEAKSKAKKALEEAEATATLSSDPQPQCLEAAPEKDTPGSLADGGCDTKQGADGENAAPSMESLEEAYQKALAAFKANKSDKDLRRAKTAARRALDDAIAASTDGKQLVCVDCSKKFVFSTKDQQKYKEKGWKALPQRCQPCKDARTERSSGMRERLDGKKKNMCYAFQRGECPHGVNCKFSHNPKHGGKRSGDAGKESDVDTDTFKVKRSKERKEQSLRKKGKGWRNK